MKSSLWWTLSIPLLATWIGAIPSDIAPPNDGEKQQHLEDINKWWDQVSTSYPRYDDTTKILNEMKAAFPDLVNIYSVGKSVQKREMWVINLRANMQQPRKLLQPPMKIAANMHGDETVGRALVLMLAVDMLKRFSENDTRVVQLLDTTDIHLMPSVNPDGFEAAPEGNCKPNPDTTGRQNANRKDLNRNFPDQFVVRKDDEAALVKDREPETLNMMKFISTSDFVLSINFHAGSVVASYPFDSVPLEVEQRPDYINVQRNVPSLSPDDDVFVYLAKLYAKSHKTMTDIRSQCGRNVFPGGITNGADWYNVRGSMQDFSYVHSNAFEITVELSCCKYPAASTLLQEWDLNQEALYKYVEATHMGIRGLVKDTNGNPIQGAEIIVQGRNHTVRTTKQGEFWRPLLPGKYKVGVSSEHHEPVKFVDVEVGSTLGLRSLGNTAALEFNMTKRSGSSNDADSTAIGNFKFIGLAALVAERLIQRSISYM